MAKIEVLPSGRYRMRVYDARTGKRKSITADSRREVKRLAAEFTYMQKRPLTDMSVKEAIDSYISNREAVLSPSTLRSYLSMAGYHYKEIGHIPVSLLSSEDVQRYINNLAKSSSPKTVRNVKGLLVAALRAVAPDKAINITLPQKTPVQMHVPTDEEVIRLFSSAKGDLKVAIMLASTGTLRRGEICSLTYEDIAGNIIHVHTDMVKGPDGWIIKEVPKTSASDRYVEYPPEVIAALGSGTGRILKIMPHSLTTSFINLRNRCEVNCRFHDLRHYAASIMHALGVPDQYIMQRGGWSSDATLKSVYRNVLEDKKNEFTELTNDYMGKLLCKSD